MDSDQSRGAETGAPRRWAEVRLRDAAWLAQYCAQAIAELALARYRFGQLDMRTVQQDNATLDDATAMLLNGQVLAARIAFVMPRVARFMPWRSDCLIQATAARRWLGAAGLSSRIVIGVERPEDAEFGAHAWLECNGEVVTGGDISRYTVLL